MKLQTNENNECPTQRNSTHIIIDKFFYTCLSLIKNHEQTIRDFYIIRTIFLMIAVSAEKFFIIDQSKSSYFMLFLIICLVINVFQVFFHGYLLANKIKNKSIIMRIAQDLRHVKQVDFRITEDNQEGEFYSTDEQIGLKISDQYYDYENSQKINDVSQEFKSIRQKNGEKIIRVLIEKQFLCYKPVNYLLHICSFASIVFGVVTTSMVKIIEVEHNMLELYIITEVLFKPHIYFCLFIIFALPFLLVAAFIYFCFCKKNQKAILPNPVKTNAQIISKCSECAICFMNYDMDEEVMVLPCSQMHVFHENCIKGWTKVKPSCPICRRQLL